MKNVFLVVLLMAFLAASCTKQRQCPATFELPIQLTPVKKEYHVGDTITVVSKFHKAVKALNSANEYIGPIDMEGVDWQPLIAFHKLDTLTDTGQPAASGFGIHCKFLKDSCCNLNIFNFSSGDNSLTGEYQFTRDSFFLAYKIILLESGEYALNHTSFNFRGNNPRDYPGKCPGQIGFDVEFVLNEGMDNNIELLATSPEPYWSVRTFSDPENKFHRFGGFCFKVLP